MTRKRTVITTSIVKEIREGISRGYAYHDIARMLDISPSTVMRHASDKAAQTHREKRKARRPVQSEESRLKRIAIWTHNRFVGRTVQIWQTARDIQLSSTTSDKAKEIALEIQKLAHDLERELRNNRIGP